MSENTGKFDTPQWLQNSPHRPPNDEKGDLRPEAIFTEVGRLTHTWETIEITLMNLFLILSETQTAAPMHAFGVIIGSNSRCDMLESVAEFYGKRIVDEKRIRDSDAAKKLIAHARRLGALRNIVAHGTVVKFEDGKYVVSADYDGEGEYFLTPAFYNLKKTGYLGSPKIWYRSSTILDITTLLQSFKLSLDYLITHQILGATHVDYTSIRATVAREAELRAATSRVPI